MWYAERQLGAATTTLWYAERQLGAATTTLWYAERQLGAVMSAPRAALGVLHA